MKKLKDDVRPFTSPPESRRHGSAMKALILNDGVSENAGAFDLLKGICDGIAAQHEIEWVNIHELHHQPCQNCLKCHPYGECVLPEDDAHRIGRMIFSADALVIGLDSSLEDLSFRFRMLLDRCMAAIAFQNKQGEICPWRKGRAVVVASLGRVESSMPEPITEIDRFYSPLLRTLEAGGFEVIGTIEVNAGQDSSVKLLSIEQARVLGCRLSRTMQKESNHLAGSSCF
jgi:multimeric flavodoxin WrbA